MDTHASRLVCQTCGARFDLAEYRWCCTCGGCLDLEFSARIEPSLLPRRPSGMWRYREAIPIDLGGDVVSFGEGMTPLISMVHGDHAVHLKLEMLFPTGSFKDRGASVSVTRALDLGARRVVEDSSGNAGCAIAAYSALGGIACHLFVPEQVSATQVARMEAFGARVIRVSGTREDAARAARASIGPGDYYASHVWDPYFHHGTKTMAYEVWEQLGGLVPDLVIVPTGHGSLLLGTYLGFADLRRQGLIKRLPALVAVQAKRCAPIARRYRDEPLPDRWGRTTATGIAIESPPRWQQVLASVWDTGGEVVEVEEEAIQEAQKAAARRGILIEPTAACALAALQVVRPPPDACVVIPLTGRGTHLLD